MDTLLHTRVRTFLLTAVFASALLLPSVAVGRDASLPYRSMPGFQCHQWNWMGECSDWSYFDYRTAPPAYGGTTAFPTYPVYRCLNPTVDCTGSVTVRGSASPNPVALGQLLTYTLYIRNDDSQARTINVRAYLDTNSASFESSTFGGFSDGNMVRWDSQRIPARMSRTIILRVRIRNDARVTEPSILRIQAGNSSDAA